MKDSALKPWYREPWPWFLMAGPAIVVVAGTITAVIAVKTNDGLVADDYYKQGLGINRVIARDERAAALNISATVQFNEERRAVRVMLAAGAPQPGSLRLTLIHGARASDDQVVALAAIAPGIYEGALREPAPGKWQLRIEDVEATWRIAGDWRTRQSTVTLGAQPR